MELVAVVIVPSATFSTAKCPTNSYYSFFRFANPFAKINFTASRHGLAVHLMQEVPRLSTCLIRDNSQDLHTQVKNGYGF